MDKKQPLPPHDLGACAMCRHFCDEIKLEFVVVNGQEIPVDVVRQQSGGILPPNLKAVPKSPCTLGPVWHMVTREWWCGQWVKRPPCIN